ncbi:hypothetical protein [Thioclava sp. JE_KL1]|uniref:hypothetical protein n=1 Tax=Thioclava sp. JE_KL1 TaxID=2651187 RepID=UPI001C12C0CC|nr:hypothetical protein [Thioclava sp. JE_KL1]
MDELMMVEVISLSIAALATAGVILRPFGWADWIFAVSGAAAEVLLRALPLSDALHAIGEGREVYFFLVGTMLLAEVEGREGLSNILPPARCGRRRGLRGACFPSSIWSAQA